MIRLPPHKPATERPIYDYTIDIEGVSLRYRLVFRPRRESWYLSTWDNSVQLITDKRCVESWPFLWRHRIVPPMPYGHIVLWSDANDGAELTTEAGLGWTHHLYLLVEDDLEPTITTTVYVT